MIALVLNSSSVSLRPGGIPAVLDIALLCANLILDIGESRGFVFWSVGDSMISSNTVALNHLAEILGRR